MYAVTFHLETRLQIVRYLSVVLSGRKTNGVKIICVGSLGSCSDVDTLPTRDQAITAIHKVLLLYLAERENSYIN